MIDWSKTVTVADKEAKVAEQARAQFKAQRTEAVRNIKVTTTAGNAFDGDEQSQTRMARALIGMQDGETIPWTLADNSAVEASKAELAEALRLAGEQQSALWQPDE